MTKKFFQTDRTAGIALTTGAKTALCSAILVTAVAATSCKKDDGDDVGTFTPPSAATETEIKGWIKEANTALKDAEQVTMTGTETEVENNVSITYSYEQKGDAKAKKKWYAEYATINNVKKLTVFYVVDASNVKDPTEYSYVWIFEVDGANYETDWTASIANFNSGAGDKKYGLGRPITDAAAYFVPNRDLIDFESSNSFYNYTFKVDDEKIVVTEGSSSDTTIYKVTLTADKKYKTLEITNIYHGEVSTRNLTYAYEANIGGFPEGISESNFTAYDRRSEYKSATVNWGEGKSSNKFWTKHTQGVEFYCIGISGYAPDVANKEITGYKIGTTSYEHSCVPIAEDGSTVIECVWGAKSSSSVAPQARPAAAKKRGISKQFNN